MYATYLCHQADKKDLTLLGNWNYHSCSDMACEILIKMLMYFYEIQNFCFASIGFALTSGLGSVFIILFAFLAEILFLAGFMAYRTSVHSLADYQPAKPNRALILISQLLHSLINFPISTSKLAHITNMYCPKIYLVWLRRQVHEYT